MYCSLVGDAKDFVFAAYEAGGCDLRCLDVDNGAEEKF
jgi:hypothetical protein